MRFVKGLAVVALPALIAAGCESGPMMSEGKVDSAVSTANDAKATAERAAARAEEAARAAERAQAAAERAAAEAKAAGDKADRVFRRGLRK